VLDDVQIDDALLNELLMSGLLNNGQALRRQTRLLAPRSRYEEIVGVLGDAVGA